MYLNQKQQWISRTNHEVNRLLIYNKAYFIPLPTQLNLCRDNVKIWILIVSVLQFNELERYIFGLNTFIWNNFQLLNICFVWCFVNFNYVSKTYHHRVRFNGYCEFVFFFYLLSSNHTNNRAARYLQRKISVRTCNWILLYLPLRTVAY